MSAVLARSLSRNLPTSSWISSEWPWPACVSSWILASSSAIGCSKSRKFGFMRDAAGAKPAIIPGQTSRLSLRGGRPRQHRGHALHARQLVERAQQVGGDAHAPLLAQLQVGAALRVAVTGQQQPGGAATMAIDRALERIHEWQTDSVDTQFQHARLRGAGFIQRPYAPRAQ